MDVRELGLVQYRSRESIGTYVTSVIGVLINFFNTVFISIFCYILSPRSTTIISIDVRGILQVIHQFA